MEKNEVERTVGRGSGVKRSEVTWSGVWRREAERSGVDWSGVERRKLKRSGVKLS